MALADVMDILFYLILLLMFLLVIANTQSQLLGILSVIVVIMFGYVLMELNF